MVKLSISLPNNTQITLESEETGVVHDILGMVLNGMDINAVPPSVPTAPAEAEENGSVEKSTDALLVSASSPPSQEAQDSGSIPGTAVGVAPAVAAPSANGHSAHTPSFLGEDDLDTLDLDRQPRQTREDYRDFCQSLNPMGDMRRVVVAAEAAGRFFGWDGVSADALGDLFDLAGWRRANSFTQTLRNAARSKFGWLERIPGRSGRYAATDIGRSIILGG